VERARDTSTLTKKPKDQASARMKDPVSTTRDMASQSVVAPLRSHEENGQPLNNPSN
jgi:hypothetical protein